MNMATGPVPAYGVPALAGEVWWLKVVLNILPIQCQAAFYRLKPGLQTLWRSSKTAEIHFWEGFNSGVWLASLRLLGGKNGLRNAS